MKLDESILTTPLARGVRLVALELLDDAHRASETLSREPDPKALHDFRVALRRLRSWVRAFDDELQDTIKKKDRRRLRDVARATNLGRDVDVQLAWLHEAAKGWSRKRRKGAEWLSEYLTARQRQAGDPVDAALLREFETVRADLNDRLSTYQEPVRRNGKAAVTLASAIAARVMVHAGAVGEALDSVRTVEDELQAHQARIAAKRLRYLIEPAAPFVAKGDAILDKLKSMQDELGTLHDAHVIGHEVQGALDAPTSSGAPTDGVLVVAERARDDAAKAFTRVHEDWLEGRFARFNRDVAAFTKRLASLHA